MTWRLLARRTVTGGWLDTDVQMAATVTEALNGDSSVEATIPYALARKASDGAPMWLERGTTLYVEENKRLVWAGLCDYVKPGKAGLDLGFSGLASAYDLISFQGKIRVWSPDPYDVVEALIANGNAQPHGNIGLTVVRDGAPVRTAGDPEPDVPRPPKPPRKAWETRDEYDDRLFAWEKAVDDWERLYGGRQPYSLGPWEAQYIGDEIRELAEEIPFTTVERHSWIDRDALTARHELVLAAELGERRQDIALVENTNVRELLEPETDTSAYANHVVVLGAGEGSSMALGESAVEDLRVRTTRFSAMKTVKTTQRLVAAAETLRKAAVTSVAVEEAKVSAAVAAGIRLGDEIHVDGRRFTGWCRVSAITRSTKGGPVTLEFDRTTDGVLT